MVTLSLVIKMNKKTWIILAIVVALLIGGGIFLYFNHMASSPNESNYKTDKTSANDTSNQIEENNHHTENQSNTSTTNERTQGITEAENTPPPTTEEQLATFTTKIYSQDSARQNNISITCKTLDGTIVKNGTTFSFCNTVGPSSTSKGYQKADIFDKDGNKKKGLGGGNCQISSTLYNALLAVPSLVVTERHAHSNSVPYIGQGKDAAVAYGSYDLKFRNDSGHDVKILASTDGATVTTTLVSIK